MKRRLSKSQPKNNQFSSLNNPQQLDALCINAQNCKCSLCSNHHGKNTKIGYEPVISGSKRRKSTLSSVEIRDEAFLSRGVILYSQPPYITSFGTQKVGNAYSFILMHLRNEDNKNSSNILVPEVVLFENTEPLDLVYSNGGHIRGMRFGKDDVRLKKKDLFKYFKQLYKLPDSKENNIARFQGSEFLLLSDADLQQVCYKSNADPFWQKLEYIQRKLPVGPDGIYRPVVSVYDSQMEYSPQLLQMAAQNMVGYLDQDDIMRQLDQENYLSYLNIKIAAFMNLKYNIKLDYCEFHYLRVRTPYLLYYLVDATNLRYENLTPALKRRELRLKAQEEHRNQRLVITKQRQAKMKHFEASPNIPKLENSMYAQFEKKLDELNIHSITYEQAEENKNQAAFQKLHPGHSMAFKQLLTRKSFYLLKDDLLGNNLRKGLVSPTKNRMFDFYQPKQPILRRHQQSLKRHRHKTEAPSTSFQDSTPLIQKRQMSFTKPRKVSQLNSLLSFRIEKQSG